MQNQAQIYSSVMLSELTTLVSLYKIMTNVFDLSVNTAFIFDSSLDNVDAYLIFLKDKTLNRSCSRSESDETESVTTSDDAAD